MSRDRHLSPALAILKAEQDLSRRLGLDRAVSQAVAYEQDILEPIRRLQDVAAVHGILAAEVSALDEAARVLRHWYDPMAAELATVQAIVQETIMRPALELSRAMPACQDPLETARAAAEAMAGVGSQLLAGRDAMLEAMDLINAQNKAVSAAFDPIGSEMRRTLDALRWPDMTALASAVYGSDLVAAVMEASSTLASLDQAGLAAFRARSPFTDLVAEVDGGAVNGPEALEALIEAISERVAARLLAAGSPMEFGTWLGIFSLILSLVLFAYQEQGSQEDSETLARIESAVQRAQPEQPPLQKTGKLLVVSRLALVRAGPEHDACVVDRLHPQHLVEWIALDGSRAHVRYMDYLSATTREGWVHTSRLKSLRESSAPDEPGVQSGISAQRKSVVR